MNFLEQRKISVMHVCKTIVDKHRNEEEIEHISKKVEEKRLPQFGVDNFHDA